MDPIKNVGISTAYGKRGSHWSCNEDSKGNGVHTGADYACAQGTNIYAPISGQIRHRSYGSAFGSHQFAISPDPGQPFADGEVFFAHTTNRPKDGVYVQAGDYLADVGSEGNATGPHLHLEFHPHKKGVWNCSVHANPQPVIDWQPGGGGYPKPTTKTVYLSKLHYDQDDSDSVYLLKEALNAHPLDNGQNIKLTGHYGDDTDEEVRLCQQQHGFGNDKPKQSNVGPQQAEHLFKGRGITVVNDL